MSAPARPITSAGSPGKAGPAPAPATPHERRAALLLHTIPAADREWMLAQLPAAERGVVEKLIAELVTLGIPADRALLEDVIGRVGEAGLLPSPTPGTVPAEQRTTPADGEGPRAHLATLMQADPTALATVLRAEPVGLVAKLLELEEWPWRGALLDALDTPARREIEAELARSRARASAPAPETGTGTVALSLREHLVAALAARLQQAIEHAPASRPRRWFRGFLARRSRG